MIYILSILWTLLFVMYSKYQFKNDSDMWHAFGMAMRFGWFISVFVIDKFFAPDWQDYLLAGAINVLVWEIAINILAIKMPVFYKKGIIEKKIGNRKWLYVFGFLALAIIIRIFI